MNTDLCKKTLIDSYIVVVCAAVNFAIIHSSSSEAWTLPLNIVLVLWATIIYVKRFNSRSAIVFLVSVSLLVSSILRSFNGGYTENIVTLKILFLASGVPGAVEYFYECWRQRSMIRDPAIGLLMCSSFVVLTAPHLAAR